MRTVERCALLDTTTRHRPDWTFGPLLWKRTAKRKTTVSVDALPQGALPPLPKIEADVPPEKAYPTVMQQHLNNVRKFNDCVVLTRVGDFYEMYFDQVDQYAPLVNLKKAKRTTALGDVAMAGFQHTQLERYLKMFVQDLGKQVAISEQIRLPEHERVNRAGGPLYDRKVTRVVTAGTLVDENFMDPLENNFLLALHVDGPLPSPSDVLTRRENYERNTKVGLSWVDLSSGDFFTQTSDFGALPSLVARIAPREIVLDASLESLGHTAMGRVLGDGAHALQYHAALDLRTSVADWEFMLERPVPAEAQAEFTSSEVAAGSLILDYIQHRLFDVRVQLQPPIRRSDSECMAIDKQSLRGLEIKATLRDGAQQGSLLHTIRRTVTKSGARLLGQRIVSPSMSLSVINHRLDLVQEFLGLQALHEDITALLRDTFDTFRLLQKFSIGRGDADDMLGLARTIRLTQQICHLLREHTIVDWKKRLEEKPETGGEQVALLKSDCFWDVLTRLDIDQPTKVAQKILDTIDEEGLSQKQRIEIERAEETEMMADEVVRATEAGEKPPSLTRRKVKPSPAEAANTEDIWIMRSTASPALQRTHKDLELLHEAKHELALQQRSKLKAESLTLKWSAQLGHFCHVKGKDAQNSLSALDAGRSISSTKTTRSFYLADWTHLGRKIDDAKLRIRTEEERMFNRLRAQVLENLMRLRRNAAVLDELDVACSSAIVAKERNLVRPILRPDTSHRIIGGRHPTVDVGLNEQGRQFTSNDCLVGDRDRIYLITGPNMAGKSTYLRQNALITILAQTGCFVPAGYAEIGLVDKIFSRVGSADNLYQDQSTFMVEMLETAEILKQATPRSFVIMDEVGRGTTPEDGVAVGYACLHHLHHVNRCRALFATHFHALADMTKDFERLACYCTDVAEEEDGSWAYVHRLRPGVNRNSHALKVARLAGLPEEAIVVARDVLRTSRRTHTVDVGDSSAVMKQSAAAAAA